MPAIGLLVEHLFDTLSAVTVGRQPSIPCVYCGHSHGSTGEVRDCWQAHSGVEKGPATEPAASVVRGPRELGRNLLVEQGAPVPEGWGDAPHLAVALDDPDLVAVLQGHAHTRTGCVLEVPSGFTFEPPSTVVTAPLHDLGPRFELTADTVHQLLTTNSIDGRGFGGFALLSSALRLGARPVADGRGDIELPDGSRAWLDGGPPRYTPPIDGVPVLHRVAIEHGSLSLPRGNATTADLATDQLEAVVHPGGSARIIAPAGSGKTRVLTERARHLITQWQLPPSAVCLVAFNKRAQEEMAERTTDLPRLQVRTLNSIALAVLNGSSPFATQPTRFTTIDEPEVRRLIGKLVKFPRKLNADPVATWLEALSLARLGLRSPDSVESLYEGEVEGFAEVLPKYRAELAANGAVDYDEQVVGAIEVLLTQPSARTAAQRACRFLLVDEFQDLTPAHLLLVRLLAGPDSGVFGVGDDDQTIYGYNGADPAWLIDFANLFPGAGEHPLEVNYRCPGGIVRAADTLLRHNRRRVAKVIRSAKPGHYGFGVAAAEGDSVAATVAAITTAIAAGVPAADIAVLTRVNSLLAPVQVALHASGIPTSGGVGSDFTQRTSVRAALAWLRLATGGGAFDPTDLAEALRRPSRSLHPRIATWVAEQSSVAGLRRLAARINTERDSERVEAFATDIERLSHLAANGGTTASVLGSLRDQMGLATSIATLDLHRRGMNRTAQSDDLTALAQLATLHPDPTTFEAWLRRALGARWQAGGVTLATVHRVKGQEWPLVIVHHADADQFPHRLADDEEEERRLFHVAITRASGEVLVVPCDQPSPFILDCTTEPSARSLQSTVRTRPTAPATSSTGQEASLFETLRVLRRQLAAGKPAYTVLPDSTLREIARVRPTSLDELAAVKGVGPAKLKQYGPAILAEIAEIAETAEEG